MHSDYSDEEINELFTLISSETYSWDFFTDDELERALTDLRTVDEGLRSGLRAELVARELVAPPVS